VLGVLTVQSYRPAAYSSRDLELLQGIADEAAVVIARLHSADGLGSQLGRRVSQLEAILANMADALLIIDAEGRLVRLYHAARELLSLDDSSIVLGQPIEQQHLEVDIAGRQVLSFRASPFLDTESRFSGGVIVFSHVTARRELERCKDDMFSIASHDLKTPATVIKLQAQLLRRLTSTGAANPRQLDEAVDDRRPGRPAGQISFDRQTPLPGHRAARRHRPLGCAAHRGSRSEPAHQCGKYSPAGGAIDIVLDDRRAARDGAEH
jgi:signal transduction histidine kinase